MRADWPEKVRQMLKELNPLVDIDAYWDPDLEIGENLRNLLNHFPYLKLPKIRRRQGRSRYIKRVICPVCGEKGGLFRSNKRLYVLHSIKNGKNEYKMWTCKLEDYWEVKTI